MRKRTLTLSFMTMVFLLATVCASAQTDLSAGKTVSGVVLNEDGDPLAGALVQMKGTSQGTVAGENGNFTLRVAKLPVTLLVSFVGQKRQEVTVTSEKKLTVTLASSTTLGTAVVRGGLIDRSKNSFTGSYKQIDREELVSVGNQNVLKTLSALDPSFVIADNYLNGSDPNARQHIVMRGGSTMNFSTVLNDQTSNPNEPLFVLDGFETTLDVINELNISRIESITLLKDASSTAIYGSKGANGVVVVETVKPKAGKVMVFYSGDYRLSTADLSVYNMMNAEEKLKYEVAAGRYGDLNDWTNTNIADYNRRLEQVKRGVDTYWLKVPVRTAFTQNHSVNVSGGNQEGFLYQIGANFRNQEGVMKESSRQSFGGDMHLIYRKGNISLSNKLAVSNSNGYTGAWGSFSDWANANPYYTMRNADGTIPKNLDEITVTKDFSSTYAPNPYYNAQLSSHHDTRSFQVTNNFAFEWRILDNLLWKTSLSLQSATSENVSFTDPSHTKYRDVKDYTLKGEYSASNGNSWHYDLKSSASYNVNFLDGHTLNVTGGTKLRSSQNTSSGFLLTGFPEGVTGNPSYAYSYKEGTRPFYSSETNRTASFFGTLDYIYNYRYVINFNYNADGSTAFGRNKKFQTFGSVGARWNVKRELFAYPWKWLDDLVLRANYGTNGNQNNSYLSSNVYTYYSGNNVFGASSYLSEYTNPNLAWETVNTTTVGIDGVALNKRLNFHFDVFHKLTDPMLAVLSQKPSSGVSSYPINLGYMKTNGYEFSVSYYFIRDLQQQITLRAGINGQHVSQKYAGFANALNNLNNQYETSSSNKNATYDPNSLIQYQDGSSPNALWAVRSLGIDPATGKEIFLTKDGQKTFEYNRNDRVKVIADASPTLQGMFTLNAIYKRFSATVFLAYSFGGYMFNNTLFNKVENISRNNVIYNQDRRALHDRWQNAGDVSQFRNIALGTTSYVSSRFIQRNNYLRGRDIRLTWDFSKDQWIKRLALADLSVNVTFNDFFDWSTIKKEHTIDYPEERAVSIGVSARF